MNMDFIWKKYETYTLSPEKTEVADGEFSNFSYVEEIEMGNKIKRIGSGAFYCCKNLKKVMMNDGVQTIEEFAFANCHDLQEINISKSVSNIDKYAFENCTLLDGVKLPNTLESIGFEAFSNCLNLKEIIIPDSVNDIGNGCFKNCLSLKEVVLPKNIMLIPNELFDYCIQLEKCILPESLTLIGIGAFRKCEKLKEIHFPKSLMNIGEYAFKGCKSLEKIYLPKNVIVGESAFRDCPNLNYIEFEKGVKFESYAFNLHPMYLSKNDDNFVLTTYEVKNSICISSSDINLFVDYYEYKDQLFQSGNFDVVRRVLNSISKEEGIKFLNNRDFRYVGQYGKIFDVSCFNAMIIPLYNLGAFSKPYNKVVKVGEVNKTVTTDYAQKVCEFLKEHIDDDYIEEMIFKYFMYMKPQGLKADFTDFFLKKENFKQMIETETKYSGFISKCYNDFEDIQLCNTSNKGKQRTLKPTFEKFASYFSDHSFVGENTPRRKEIAKLTRKYYGTSNNAQSTFNDIVNIDEERQKYGVKKNILSRKLKEDIFQNLETLKSQINESQINTLHFLAMMASKEFTFEWLEKDDLANFVLGKFCSCCSHVEGVGYSIMRASIIHPDIQNLVIKNKSGKIVAKSTLYINREQGYGICNTVEVSEDVNEADKIKIYDKFKTGVRLFAEIYNNENPEKRLKQINVGMDNNDLGEIITLKDVQQKEILRPLNFMPYGKDEKNYYGDSFKRQYKIWDDIKEF